MKEVTGTFTFDGDTKRMHRFHIKNDDGKIAITGNLYIPKDGPGIPKRIVLDNPRSRGTEQESE